MGGSGGALLAEGTELALVAGAGGICTTGEPSGVAAPGSAMTSGSVPLTKVASCNFPRGANAVFVAGIAFALPPPIGPPHTPRTGFLHVIGPAKAWRIA